MERRDLLLEEKTKKPIDRDKLARDLDEGMALVNMMETRGWKILFEGFIKPNTEESKFLEAPREELADIRAEMRALKKLLKFIDTRVEKANDAASKIKQ